MSSLVIADTGSFTTKTPMSAEVSVPSLTALNLSGSGQLSVTGIKAPQLIVVVSGSGLLNAAGTATKLNVTLSGAGQVELSHFGVWPFWVGITLGLFVIWLISGATGGPWFLWLAIPLGFITLKRWLLTEERRIRDHQQSKR